MNELETYVYLYCKKEKIISNISYKEEKRRNRNKQNKEKHRGMDRKKSYFSDKWLSYLGKRERHRRFRKLQKLCGNTINSAVTHKYYDTNVIYYELPFSLPDIRPRYKIDTETVIRQEQNTIKKLLASQTALLKQQEESIAGIWYDPDIREIFMHAVEIATENESESDTFLVDAPYPIRFLKALYREKVKDGILLIRDGSQAYEFIKEIYEDINRLLIFTSEQEKWQDLAGWLYGETGLVVQYDCEAMQYAKVWENKCLFDFNESAQVAYRRIPKGTRYIDLMVTKEKQRIIEGKRKDIQYYAYPQCMRRFYTP